MPEPAQKATSETKFGITTILTAHESSLLCPLAKLSVRSAVSKDHRGGQNSNHIIQKNYYLP